jgi:DNA-binding response OmpR family regulator
MATRKSLVLVVDDEPNLCNVLRRILEKEGYQVLTAPDGEAALQIIKEKVPDVVLLDLMMPGIDGREVCWRVREFSPKTRIIYFTAKTELTSPSEVKELYSGADAFISKPASSKRILSTVDSILNSRRNNEEYV